MALLRKAKRLRPRLLGSLAPVQYNIWFGRAVEGSTSGLHHDYHDNLYVLLRGQKEFKLFSPRCVDLLRTAGAASGRPTLHANGLICYGPGIREDGALSSRARRAKASTGVESDDDEAMLESALDAAMCGGGSAGSASEDAEGSGLPASFSAYSTSSSAGSKNCPPVPSALRGLHLTAALTPGDVLYLPASWFHEVVSSGAGPGGHLALNLWMAPPWSRGTFEKPYEDDFWESKYASLRDVARAGRVNRRRSVKRGSTTQVTVTFKNKRKKKRLD
jgi:hypothetical protein